MVLVLPTRLDGLELLESRFASGSMTTWIGALRTAHVAISLPKLDISPSEPLSVVPALRGLGVESAFVPASADFSGIASPSDPADRIYIGNVFHKAHVKVDEKGVEASAGPASPLAPGRRRQA